MKNLVIVESPAKAKTIEKFLGKDYTVLSSYGHIRDLARKDFTGDINSDFTVNYEIPADKKAVVAKLKAEAAKADTVWLASDEDREGEAIAWHLAEVLNLDPTKTKRIVFHEITKPAILNAIANPRHIDIDLVNAQQARRVLDRIVGFELSPVLWRKIKPALSAGRVQSVAVRLICEREKEIRNFTAEPYFRASAIFTTPQAPGSKMKADHNGKFATLQDAEKFLESCRGKNWKVKSVTVKPLHRSPQPPFTTSTLQQAAGSRLGFPVGLTMSIAQKLYEEGLITYMRTDSMNLSQLALATLATEIKSEFGDNYLHTRQYHTKAKGAQEAHEAIRPTYPDRQTINGTANEKRLYELIWKRTVASQMADAQLMKTNIDVEAYDPASGTPVAYAQFTITGESVTFDGFMKVWQPEAVGESSTMLPSLATDDALTPISISTTERYTQPQPRFTEASLVKKLEELGIGRPSTYAPTISTIQSREYVRKGENEGSPREFTTLTLEGNDITSVIKTENTGSDRGKLVPTDIGMIVNDFLTDNFPDILDYNFTARVEEKFDDIAEGKLPWKSEINDFYTDFHPTITKVSEMRTEHKTGERMLGTEPGTGEPVSVKIGRFGPVAQIGSSEGDTKPRFASLLKTQSIATITLEEALELFRLPREVGEYEGAPVKAAIGRFGPYISYGKLFVSIPKELDPLTITIDEATELIRKKQEAEANKLIADFPELNAQILNGRFGPYIAHKPEKARKAVNYRIPKGTDPRSLTADAVKDIMEKQDAAPKKTRKK